jgi:Ni/Co efflux regulator RcnB
MNRGSITAEELRDEMERFNDYRRMLLRDEPPVQGKRMPIEWTYVGGDIPENGE